jgi:protein gp37
VGEETAISWCDHTFNLWIGCWKIDPECENCYAKSTDDQRWGGEHWGRKAPRKWTGDAYWKQLLKWQRAAREAGVRRRVFVGSLMDWAETHPVPEIQAEMDRRRTQFWELVRICRDLDFLMLTKRIEDAPKYLPWYSPDGAKITQAPWPNVWLGSTAGTIKNLREHAHALRHIAAAVRFISGEPLLEDIPRSEWDLALGPRRDYSRSGDGTGPTPNLPPIDWLIIGGESGSNRRPMHEDWVRTARDAAKQHGVAFHYKQRVDGDGRGKKIHLPVLDGRVHAAFPEPT